MQECAQFLCAMQYEGGVHEGCKQGCGKGLQLSYNYKTTSFNIIR